MSIKTISAFFTVLALLSWGCHMDAFTRYPVQGKWKIEQVRCQLEGKPDSVVTADLGFLLFHECSQDSNNIGTGKVERIHSNRKVEKFNYATRLYKNEAGDTKRLFMSQFQRKAGDNEMRDLQGRFIIDELSEQEMKLSCTDCQIGTLLERAPRFELRATKIAE